MEDAEVYLILKEQGEAARVRQRQLKILILLTWVYMLVITAIFALSFNTVTNSNEDLAETLERRSPVLEYMACRADFEDRVQNLQSQKDNLTRTLLITFIEKNEQGTKEAQVAFDVARNEYNVKTNEIQIILDKPSTCDSLPD